MSTARCRRPRRSRTSTPASSRSQRGSALSDGEVAGRLAQRLAARRAIAIASAGVALLARAPALGAPRRVDERRAGRRGVASGIEPPPRTTRPPRPQPRDEVAARSRCRTEPSPTRRRRLDRGPGRLPRASSMRPVPLGRAIGRACGRGDVPAARHRRAQHPAPRTHAGSRGRHGTLPSDSDGEVAAPWRRRAGEYVGARGRTSAIPAGTLAAAVRALARAARRCGCAACRGSTPRRPSGVTRPAGVPQRRRGAGRAGRRAIPRHGRLGAARRAQGTRALVRPTEAGALGPALRSTSDLAGVRSPPRQRRAPARGSLRRPGEGVAAAGRTAHRGAAEVVRPGAPVGPGPRARAAWLGRDGRDGRRPPARPGGPRRSPSDRDLGRRWLDAAPGCDSAGGRICCPASGAEPGRRPDRR